MTSERGGRLFQERTGNRSADSYKTLVYLQESLAGHEDSIMAEPGNNKR